MTHNNNHNFCLVCGGKKNYYNFTLLKKFRVEECFDCKLMRLNPQPTYDELDKIYQESPVDTSFYDSTLYAHTAENYLNILETSQSAPLSGSLLEIGYGDGEFLLKATAKGLKVTGLTIDKIETTGKTISANHDTIINQLSNLTEKFDYIVLNNVLQHAKNPRTLLKNAHTLLKENGTILALVPSLDSFSARVMKRKWVEFRPERFWYFSRTTLTRLFHTEHFGQVKINSAKKAVNINYLAKRFKHYPVKPYTSFFSLLQWLLPQSLQQHPFHLAASNVAIVAQKTKKTTLKKLSVVMPIYNEKQNVRAGIERVLTKHIPDIDIELIIIESQSTDGSREIVQLYEGHKQVKIIWQDAPRGKGSAVRMALTHITGDIVVIQDADAEYDIDDYNVLIEPIINGETAFVLGARHGGRAWKMRQFSEQIISGHIINFGHWFFTSTINILFGLRLTDPFTMYKIFRTDCLNNLTFECDLFDFDFELLIKLVQNGYLPMEIPVNYRSRSFKEGKKIQFFRDTVALIKAIIKFRFQKKQSKKNLIE